MIVVPVSALFVCMCNPMRLDTLMLAPGWSVHVSRCFQKAQFRVGSALMFSDRMQALSQAPKGQRGQQGKTEEGFEVGAVGCACAEEARCT